MQRTLASQLFCCRAPPGQLTDSTSLHLKCCHFAQVSRSQRSPYWFNFTTHKIFDLNQSSSACFIFFSHLLYLFKSSSSWLNLWKSNSTPTRHLQQSSSGDTQPVIFLYWLAKQVASQRHKPGPTVHHCNTKRGHQQIPESGGSWEILSTTSSQYFAFIPASAQFSTR